MLGKRNPFLPQSNLGKFNFLLRNQLKCSLTLMVGIYLCKEIFFNINIYIVLNMLYAPLYIFSKCTFQLNEYAIPISKNSSQNYD